MGGGKLVPVTRVYLALDDSEHKDPCPEATAGWLCYRAPVARSGMPAQLMWVHELFLMQQATPAHLVVPTLIHNKVS